MQQNARGNYIADMLWLIAGGKRYEDGSIDAFSVILRENPKKEETAKEIVAGVIGKLREVKNESI